MDPPEMEMERMRRLLRSIRSFLRFMNLHRVRDDQGC
jgi:hypothetical protein